MKVTTTRKPRARWQRFVLGDDLAGGRITDATFWSDDVTSLTRSRWARLAGWKRGAVRVGATITTPPVVGGIGWSVYTDPALWANHVGAAAVAAGAGLVQTGYRAAVESRFRATYVRPLDRVIAPVIGERPGRAGRWLHISPDMPGLAARLARPMSPAEESFRSWYGSRIQPVLTWVPERVMQAYWFAHGRSGPIRKAVDWVRIPTDAAAGTSVQITIRSGFATREQRELIRQAVAAKLGLSDLLESWDQVGRVAVGTFTVRERPPAAVGIEDVTKHLPRLGDAEFFIGLTTGGRPVIVSLDDDAPHIACSAGSGAGKSVLAKLIGMQVLERGGEVLILDRKGSHRWARGLPGVRYCTKPADMHDALIDWADEADRRNDQALDEDEGWVPGRRRLVIFEEMNATVAQLRQWWDTARDKSDPKISPAIVAFRNLMFMGRSAWTHLFGVAQMLTSNTTGGPESRENFGIRFMARYTANNWKMLAPECPMPKRSKVRGRWQVVISGEATEVQVAYLSDAQVWELLGAVPASPTTRTTVMQGKHTGTTPVGDEFPTMAEIVQRVCPGVNVEAIKKRRSRARMRGEGPTPRGRRGRAETYDPREFAEWLAAEGVLAPSTKENVR